MSNYILLKKGEFAYNKSYSKGFPVGSIKRLEKYDMGALSTLYICFEAKQEKNLYADYLKHYFDSDCWYEQVNYICSEGARNHGILNVTPDDFFLTTHYLAPKLEEQKKVSMFLDKFNELIEIQQNKVKAIKKRNNAFIQRIFDGVITIGKKEKWKDYTLDEVLVEYKEMHLNDGRYPHVSLTTEGVVPKTERYNRDHLVTHDDKKYRITHLNDICYNPANLKFGVICRNRLCDSIFSPIYVTFKVNDGFDFAFIESLVTKEDFINYALQFEEGSVYERMSVSPKNLLGIAVQIPSLESQKKICKFISLIDDQLKLEENKLNTYKNIKQGLLQQLFI
jgi:type I restriction enzyme S subunit